MSISAPAARVTLAPPGSVATGGDAAWEGLLPVLQWLDALLAPAVEMARLRFGDGAAADPYRGLRITDEQIDRALATPPGSPLLYRDATPDAAAGHGAALALFARCSVSKPSISTSSSSRSGLSSTCATSASTATCRTM